MTRTVFLLSGAILFLAFPVHAQFNLNLDGATSIRMTPDYPRPGERVDLTLSTLSDPSEREIIWRANDEIIAQGVGTTRATVGLGALGTPTKVSVTIDGEAGPSLTIVPTSVDLVWEAESYVPPLYRGRALPSQGSTVRIQAIPHLVVSGTELSPADLTYTWRSGTQLLQSASGRGKSSISVSTSVFSDTTRISVIVTGGDLAGEGVLTLTSVEPVLRLYEESAIFGTRYDRALSQSHAVQGSEQSFRAIPFFFPVSSARDQRVRYDWQVNKNSVRANEKDPNLLTINAANSPGLALIELALTHASNFFTGTSGSWSVLFRSAGGSTENPFNGY